MPGLFDGYLYDPKTYDNPQGLFGRLLQQAEYTNPQGPGLGPMPGAAPALPAPQVVQPNAVAIPPNAEPAIGQMQQAPQGMQAQQPQEAGNPLLAGLEGFVGGAHNGLVGAISGGLGGLFSGRTQAMQQAPIIQALVQKGIDPAVAKTIVKDPQMLRTVLPQVLGTNADTNDTKEYKFYAQQQTAAGKQPASFYDYMVNLAREKAMKVTQNNNGENAYDKAMGTGFAKRYEDINGAGDKAFSTLGTINVMRQAMSSPDFYSGRGAEMFALPLKQAIAAFGGDPNAAASMETFRSQANKAVLDAMGGSLGTGVSNADRDFIVSQTPTLGNTPAGNQALLGIAEKVAKRQIEVAKLTQDYVQRNGRLDAGYDRSMTQWKEANPLFSAEERKSVQSSAGPAAAAAASTAPVMRYNTQTKKMEPVR